MGTGDGVDEDADGGGERFRVDIIVPFDIIVSSFTIYTEFGDLLPK